MKKNILLLFLLLGFIAKSQNRSEVNTEFNDKYKKSKTSKTGTLPKDELFKIKDSLEDELQIKFVDEQTIVIHYFQYGSNCLIADFSEVDFSRVLNNIYRISNSTEKRLNLKNYFVYNSNSFFESTLSKEEAFVLDKGFLKESIFTEDENCEGFYLLKSDGRFLLYYGEDYFDDIENFLMK